MLESYGGSDTHRKDHIRITKHGRESTLQRVLGIPKVRLVLGNTCELNTLANIPIECRFQSKGSFRQKIKQPTTGGPSVSLLLQLKDVPLVVVMHMAEEVCVIDS